ncbi:MAG: zinc-dependent metalloprotease [Planctomycetaceae bacterium]|nr:zinc-dependent metalloprotease [Planctomycetaceae bacterium]
MQQRFSRIAAVLACVTILAFGAKGGSSLAAPQSQDQETAASRAPGVNVSDIAPVQSGVSSVSLTVAELEAVARTPSSTASRDAIKPFVEIAPDAVRIDGLIPLYKHKNKLYAEITGANLNTDYLIAMAIAKGTGASAIAGYTLGSGYVGEDWLWQFRKTVDDRIQVVRRNIRYKADSAPESKAVELAYSDSTLYSLPIVAKGTKGGDVIDLDSIFMSDLPRIGSQLGGYFVRDRSMWGEVKNFPGNVEIRVEATYSISGRVIAAPDSSAAGVTLHYSISKLPSTGYQPRLADDRIGYFTTVHKNFSRNQQDDHFVRYINRWNVQKDEPNAAMSLPKEPITFWIENTVPKKYRYAVMEGILEWNKAFEKVGIVNAIEVRIQPDDATWDPEDIRYNTFRWITADAGFAMGPSHVNPLTGQILDADIIFDAGFVDAWRRRYDVLIAEQLPSLVRETSRQEQLAVLRGMTPPKEITLGADDDGEEHSCKCAECNYSHLMADQIAFGALALAVLNAQEEEEQPPARERTRRGGRRQAVEVTAETQEGDSSETDAEAKDEADEAEEDAEESTEEPAEEPKKEEPKLSPEELKKKIEEEFEKLVLAGLKDVVMHEVGHTLGLRHNFKASSWLTIDEINDPERSKDLAIAGSVMDYLPLNIMPKGEHQGSYFMPTIGPYDYLAIEYGYKPLSGGTDGEAKELRKIAARQAEKGMNYATDEDARMSYNPDPLSQIRDLGANPMDYAKVNARLYDQLLPGLLDRAISEGDNYADVRFYFNVLLAQRVNSIGFVARNVGGLYVNRDRKGDPGNRTPIEPVDAALQRESLQFICEQVFAVDSFNIPADLYNSMGTNRWSDWGSNAGRPDFSLRSQLLSWQLSVLTTLLDTPTLGRMDDTEMRVPEGEDVLTIAELLDTLTAAVFKELESMHEGEFTVQNPAVSTLRRSLQEKYYLLLSDYASGDLAMFYSIPDSCQVLARVQLSDLKAKIGAVLAGDAKIDTASRAHLQNLGERIAKLLNAEMIRRMP